MHKTKIPIIISVILIGCTNRIATTSQGSPNILISPTSALSGVPEKTFVVEQSCPKIEDFSKNTTEFVALQSVADTNAEIFILDMETKLKKDIHFQEDTYISPQVSISSNGKYIALFEHLSNGEVPPNEAQVRVSIFDSGGNIIASADDVESNWNGLLGWLNSDQLLLDVFQSSFNASPFNTPFLTLVINPLDQFSSSYRLKYPSIDLSRYEYLYWWGAYSMTTAIYSPDLKFALYAYTKSDWVLWDITNNKEVNRIHLTFPVSSAPRWSPNGRAFIFETSFITDELRQDEFHDELYTMDTNGAVRKITDFSNHHYEYMNISQPTWSLDGSKIAFWYSTLETGNSYNLGYFDLKINQAVFFPCISDMKWEESTIHDPYWSADGSEILIRNSALKGDKIIYETSIVNINENSMFSVGKDIIPLGWIVK